VSLFGSAWAQLGAVGLLAVFVLASDQRADETVRLLTEMVSAMRSVEALVRDQRRAPGADAA
jgi:hypothetical protein